MTESRVRAIRGATTVEEDTPEAIGDRVRELLNAIMERNHLVHDDVISILLTSTADLTSDFPAAAARTIGFGDVPLMCAIEIPVVGSMKQCVRVMMHVYTTQPRETMRHVYLHDAKGLRDDLPG